VARADTPAPRRSHAVPVTDATSLIAEALTLGYFSPTYAADWPEITGGVVPIPALFVPQAKPTPLVVVLGENASGKSFLRRVIQQICREVAIECIHLSMEGRGGEMGGMQALRSMVYGNERECSTGANSVKTVLHGIRTCQAREARHVIFWDEPDLGLAEGGCVGMGQTIAAYARAPNPLTVAAIVVTHSKPLVRELATVSPHYLHLGTAPEAAPPTVQAWLDAPVVPRSLESIVEAGHARRRLIEAVLHQRQRTTSP